MYEIFTADNHLIARTATQVEAVGVALDLPAQFRPYAIRRLLTADQFTVTARQLAAAAVTARQSVLDDAYAAGEIVWVNDMPVTK